MIDMAKFFIGQRVKKVRGSGNVGSQAIVVGLGVFTHDSKGRCLSHPHTVRVQWFGDWINSLGDKQPASLLAFDMLENFDPVVPDGMQPVSWEECLWQPDAQIA